METITEISGNLVVEIITGKRNSSEDQSLDTYNLLIRVAAGARRLDLEQLVIVIEDNNTCAFLKNTTVDFTLTKIRDVDNSFNADNSVYVINSGDLIDIGINATEHGLAANPRCDIAFTLIPESGNPVRVDLTTPNSFGVDQVVRIYPASAIT